MKIHIILFLCSWLIFIQSCKKCDENIIHEDPCSSKNFPVSDFSILTEIDTGSGDERAIRLDSVGAYPDIFFSAKDTTCDEYEWQIGKESKKRYGKEIYVRFFNPDSESLSIGLKAKKFNSCLDKNLIDSTSKILYIKGQKEGYSPFLNKFVGRDLVSGIDGIEIEGKFITEDILSLRNPINVGFGGDVVLFVKFPSCSIPSALSLGIPDTYSSYGQAGGPLGCTYTRILDDNPGQVFLTNQGKKLVIKGFLSNNVNLSDPIRKLHIEAIKQ